MADKTYRTCQHCGTVDLNSDYCSRCGAITNVLLKRKLEREQRAIEKQRAAALERPHAITLFFENALEHRNLVVRSVAWFFYSIWVIVIAIGSFLAWLFMYIVA